MWEDTIGSELEELRSRSLFRKQRIALPVSSVEVLVEGRKLVSFAKNDYLALASHPNLVSACVDQDDSNLRSTSSDLSKQWGSGASPLLAGRGPDHERLEKLLASFEHTQGAILFSSGYAANLGVISTVARDGDLILSDQLNHASLIDGCRLSRAKTMVYRHCDMDHLANLLEEHAPHFRHTWIISDTVFSMDGNLAPIETIARLASEHHAEVLLDEAHATGVYGRKGAGLVEELGLESRISVRVGTLGKAVGSIGGFCVGSKLLIEWLNNRCRSYIYSTAFPAGVARAAIAGIELIQAMNGERISLRKRSEQLRSEVRDIGYETRPGDSPIVPIYLGSSEAALKCERLLLDQGIYAPAIRPPTVPIDGAMVRISLSTGHTEEHYQLLLHALKKQCL